MQLSDAETIVRAVFGDPHVMGEDLRSSGFRNRGMQVTRTSFERAMCLRHAAIHGDDSKEYRSDRGYELSTMPMEPIEWLKSITIHI